MVGCYLFDPGVAAAQGLAWKRTFGGEGDEIVNSAAVDGEGRTVLVGYFEGEVDLDPGPGEHLVTSNGELDAFVMRLDQDGDLDWVRTFGGPESDYATGVSLDDLGNVFVVGAFRGAVDMDPGTGTATLTSAGGHDVFLTKYAPNGEYLGAWRTGGAGYDEAKSVAVGGSGGVYVLSYFTGTIDADPGDPVLSIASEGQLDVLVQRFLGDGTLGWAHAVGGAGTDFGLSLALDVDENIWMTGSFESTIDLDPGAGVAALTSAGAWDVFVAKWASNGTFLWAGRMGGPENFDTGYDLAVDGEGNTWVIGSFFGSADFDPGAGVHTLTASSEGSDDVFVVKLAADGEFLWAGSFGGGDADLGYGIGVNTGGQVLLTGFFSGLADLDPSTEGVFEVSTSEANYFDGFLSLLDGDGTFIRAWTLGGAGSIATQSMVVSDNGMLTMVGHFENTVDLDAGPGESMATSAGFRDAFVLRMSDVVAGIPPANDQVVPLLSPNPAGDHLVVELGSAYHGVPYTITDTKGCVVARGVLRTDRTSVPVAHLREGAYRFTLDHPAVRGVGFVVER